MSTMTSYSNNINWGNQLETDVVKTSTESVDAVKTVEPAIKANTMFQRAIDYSKNYFASVGKIYIEKENVCTR